MAIVKLSGTVEIGKIDQILTVQTPQGKAVGTLHFSKGSVEWWPKGHKVKAHRFTWAQFAQALENHSAPVSVGAKKSTGAAKKAAGAAAKSGKKAVKRLARTKPTATE
ncbi:hypothetical protein Q3O97_12310 [Ralstonia pseudosolanacearum]|uniref:hypothetical protein n=1 Tax=Ralstonia pseudosolanacearum TaxID=1310165 RepID=UPI002705522D|nr:hypothetical protein [Ralstonia pseudosolanacearum]MDO3616633.1 hypothetical protein [Ralstonia pseudosolanacearum]